MHPVKTHTPTYHTNAQTLNIEVNKNELLGGQFLMFLPNNQGKYLTGWTTFNFERQKPKLCVFPIIGLIILESAQVFFFFRFIF